MAGIYSIQNVIDDVGSIAAIADSGDHEKAHNMEDGLRARVLLAVAEGELKGARATYAARLALSTKDIVFSRFAA